MRWGWPYTARHLSCLSLLASQLWLRDAGAMDARHCESFFAALGVVSRSVDGCLATPQTEGGTARSAQLDSPHETPHSAHW